MTRQKEEEVLREARSSNEETVLGGDEDGGALCALTFDRAGGRFCAQRLGG